MESKRNGRFELAHWGQRLARRDRHAAVADALRSDRFFLPLRDLHTFPSFFFFDTHDVHPDLHPTRPSCVLLCFSPPFLHVLPSFILSLKKSFSHTHTHTAYGKPVPYDRQGWRSNPKNERSPYSEAGATHSTLPRYHRSTVPLVPTVSRPPSLCHNVCSGPVVRTLTQTTFF